MKFKLFGVKITLSFLFAAITALIICIDKSGLALPALSACLLHEAGHLSAMRLCGVQPSELKLIPAGVIIIAPFFKRTRDDLLITASGPLANFLTGCLLAALYKLLGHQALLSYSAVNTAVGAYNLLPVCGLDGGTLLTLFLAGCGVSCEKAESAVSLLTVFIAAGALMLFTVLLLGGNLNLSLVLFAVYMLICGLVKR